MKYTGGILIGAALLAGGVYFFNSDRANVLPVDDDTPLALATSFYPLEFVLERIVGDLGTVTNIGAGRDPHDFRPSTQDIVTLKRADAVVLQGADFEPWSDDVQAGLEADGVPVIIATADVELHKGGHEHEEKESHTEDHTDEHHDDAHEQESHNEHQEDHEDEPEHGAYDPHTWLDPVLFSDMVEHLAAEITLLDPNNADTYMNNAADLQAKLAILHTQYENELANCTLDEVITSHDAFGYMGDRYGFEIHTIAGLSTQDTPSAITLAELQAEAAEGIGAILLEENSITAYGETLARETGLQTLSVNPIAYLIPDGANYLSLMEENLNTFSVALNCNE